MAWAFVRPKRTEWLRGFVVALAASMFVYVLASWWAPWSPGRWGGLTFGSAATTIFVVDALYPLRRRLMAWPFGTAQRWLQFHIYGGVLACVCVFIHMGFRLPAGQLGWWLLALSVWSTASGLAGVYLQKSIPAMLAANLSVEAIYDRIPAQSARLQAEADRLLVGAPDLLRRFYLSNLRTWLGVLMPSWSYIVDFRDHRERRLAPIREMTPFLSEADRGRWADVQAIVIEKFELDVQYSLQRILKTWAPLHALPSLLLMGLLAVHIVGVLLF